MKTARKRRLETAKNRRFVSTDRLDESGKWYVLDNAGIIMPAVSDEVATGLFRIEFLLTEDVDTERLRIAVAQTAVRFPYFNVTLKRGFFWYYFDHCPESPLIYDDSDDPCQGWNINRKGTRMFRIRVQGRLLAGEFSHALADGSGAMSFMKTLLVRYFELGGLNPEAELGTGAWKDIFSVDAPMRKEECEDGYHRYFPDGLPHPDKNPDAWHIPGQALPKGRYRVIYGSLPLAAALEEAKRRGVTLTELLGAVYLDALQGMWFDQPRRPSKRYISVEIPVNLRSFFPSSTNRNFSLFILLRENMQLGPREFDELVQRAHFMMKLENDPRSIARQIQRNVGGARKLAVRLVPLVIKDFFARLLFAKLGESMLSGFISNLGAVRLPEPVARRVRSVGFIPAPSKTTFTNASVVSWNDELIIAFGSLARSRDLERRFFLRLRRLGLPVRISARGGQEE